MKEEQSSIYESQRLSLGQQIIKQTYIKFNQLFYKKFKKQYQKQNIYTVICSIGIIHKQTNTFQIVGLANGTKSLPYSLYAQNKTFLLKDMHAQILVIKTFRRFILKQLSKESSIYFVKDQKRQKFYFDKMNYELFLFSSEPFCGDCSIQEEQQLFSGGKPLKYFDCDRLPNEKFEKNVLRTKPGRMDLPQNKKSLNLSCSDKLALYNVLGIQGKQLFDKITPVYIDFFIVQSKPSRKKCIESGLNFVSRLSHLRSQPEQKIKRKIFNIIINRKERKISNQFKANNPKVICHSRSEANAFQIKQTNQMQNKLIEVNQKAKKKQKQGFQVSLVYSLDHHEWINSKTGLPEGCSLNNFKKKGKISTFCKKRFLQAISSREISNEIEQKKDPNTEQTFKYSAIKDRIKLLFRIWTDTFKPKPIKETI